MMRKYTWPQLEWDCDPSDCIFVSLRLEKCSRNPPKARKGIET